MTCAGMVTALLPCLPACADPGVLKNAPAVIHVGDAPMDTLAQEYHSGVTQRRRDVLRSARELTELSDQVYANRGAKPALPVVDFQQSMVIVASMGTRATGGYTIAVERVYQADARLQIVVRETVPGRSCGVTPALTQPVMVVRVPRTDHEPTFVERSSVHECT